MKKIFLLAIVYSFWSTSLFAQGETTNTQKPAKDLVQDAEKYINQQQFQPAKDVLEAAIKQKENFAIAYRLLGIVNSKLRLHEESILAYERLFQLQPSMSKAAYFECGISYMKMYQYDKALSYFNLYKNADARDYKTDETTVQLGYNMYLAREIRSCQYARGVNLKEMKETAVNLGTAINTAADEYLPTLTGDGRWLLFTSNGSGENVLISKPKSNGEWDKARSISPAINTPQNEGMAKLTVCGRMIYFSACGWENVEGGCDIFEADFDTQNDFAVVDAVRPAEGLNSPKWESQPAISCDGKMMFFASTREGGRGGTDLWMSTLGDDGIWNVPVNMGAAINTEGDEEAPYIAPDGVTLYFSSDGHPGFGEADIFRSIRKEDGTWDKPSNLGHSVNTPYREAGIVISPDGTVAYYSSAQDGGQGGLDIFRIPIHPDIAPKDANVMVDAYVYDAATKEPIENVKVKIGKSGAAKQEFKTDKHGRFFVCFPEKSS
jgi:Tol biopolymer transport system component